MREPKRWLQLLALAACALAMPSIFEPVEAEVVRTRAAAVRGVKSGAPTSRAAVRESRPVLVQQTTRVQRTTVVRRGPPIVRQSVSVRSTVSLARVATFSQRAAGLGATALVPATASSIPSTFVNGYRINDLGFRTGDFFDHQQNKSGQ